MTNLISDDYIAGFVDGEGMFYIGIVPSTGSSRNKSGWQVIYFFKVSQNPNGKYVLDSIKKRLKCGYIKSNSKPGSRDKTLAFVVRDLPSIKKYVIPFFQENLVIKRQVFQKFSKVVDLVSQRKHLEKDGMKKILDIAYSMNTGKRKVSKEEILSSY